MIQACIDELQREAFDRRRGNVADYKRAMDVWKDTDKSDRGPRPDPPPPLEHFYTTDATTEAVTKILAEDGSCTPGVSVAHNELAGWIGSFDAYRAAADRTWWLTSWDGSAVKSERAGRETLYAPEPSVSVVGGIQPDRLPILVEEAGKRDGFIERMLFAYPVTSQSPWTEDVVRPETRRALVEAFRALRGAVPTTVHLDKEAKRLFVDWVNANAESQGRAAGLIKGYYVKLGNQLARICLILHCLARPESPGAALVDAATMQAAIDVVEYFRAHAHKTLAAFGAAASTSLPLSRAVLRILEAEDGAWIAQTEIHRRLGGRAKGDVLSAALDELTRTKQAESRTLPPAPQGGRSATEWRRAGGENPGTRDPSSCEFDEFDASTPSHEDDRRAPAPDPGVDASNSSNSQNPKASVPRAAKAKAAPAKAKDKRVVCGVEVLTLGCWTTPPEIFDPLHEEFGFGLDVCAEPETAKVGRYFTPADDGLTQPWDTEKPNWCNPPYSRGEIERWLGKAWKETKRGATTVALVPHDASTRWWGMWVRGLADGQDPTMRVEVRELAGRVRFLNPDTGQPAKSGYSKPCAIVVYRPAKEGDA